MARILPVCEVNPGVVVYVNESAEIIRPRAKLGSTSHLQLNASNAVPDSATKSELIQLVRHCNERLDPHLGTGVDIYCVLPGIELAAWFWGVLSSVIADLRGECVIRLHGFASSTAAEVLGWLEFVKRSDVTSIPGGLYLLARSFRGVVLDRQRANVVLAHLLRTYLMTGKSRFPETAEAFSTRRSSSGFRVCLSAIEGYRSCEALKMVRVLLHRNLLGHLYPEFSPLVRDALGGSADSVSPGSFEWALTSMARRSSGIEALAELLMANDEFSTQGINARRMLADLLVEDAPPVPPLHGFEKGYSAESDPEVLTAVRTAVSALIGEFPLPIQHLCDPASRQGHQLSARWDKYAEEVCIVVWRRFHEWAFRHHREWMRPDIAPPGSSLALVGELGSEYASYGEKVRAFASAHVDPKLSRDSREELCPGTDQIQFIHMLPIWVKE